MTARAAVLICVISSLLVSPFALAEEEPGHLAIGAGAFDVSKQQAVSAVSSLQYYSGYRYRFFERPSTLEFKGIGPMLGLMANADGGIFGYGGGYAAVTLADKVYLLPSAGIGGYTPGSSKDLGGVLQFHLGAGLFYQLPGNGWFPAGLRFGVTYAHISNAFIHKYNPGADTILGSISMPLPMGF